MAKITIMGCATDTDELERVVTETESILAANARKKRGDKSGADKLRNADGSINARAVFSKWNKKHPRGKKREDQSDDD